jgi:protein ImuB
MSNFRVPCYDDLTPPIPDVSPGEVFDVARVLIAIDRQSATGNPNRQSTIPQSNPQSTLLNPQWFACLRSTRSPEALMPIAQDFSPRIQRHGPSAVVLDVSGLGRLLGDAQAIGAELCRAARERSNGVQVSIAPTQAAALLLACAAARGGVPPGPVVVSAASGALAPMPLAILREVVGEAYGGADGRHDRAFDVLRLWGLTTIGEFAALPAMELSERMGQAGLALQSIARGIDPAPLVPDPGVPRFVESIELEWPIEQLEALSFVLPRLLDPLALALERADKGAAAIRVDLRLADRTTHARVLQLPAAMRDPRVLRTLVLLDLESHPPGAGIDVVTIEVDPAPARVVQYSLLERARPSPETVATLTARLYALVGESRCGTPVLLDTHRPDGFELRRFTGETGSGGAGGVGGWEAGGAGGWGVGGALGVGGTRHPQLPSSPTPQLPAPPAPRLPGSPAPQLRRFRPPVAIRVTVARGRPAAVAIDRRGMPGGCVARAAGPWRTSGAWWDGAGHWDRDEWDVEVAEGVVCRIFRDRVTEQWFLEGVID